jgi:uncharacterized membrane protein YbhN (UPF0104 family)
LHPATSSSEHASPGRLAARIARVRAWFRAHPVAVTVAGSSIVALALVIGLWSKRDDFATALGDAPFWILGIAVLLQIAWLLLRSEAWHVCVGAAGGVVSRRRLYRASSVGYLGNIFNANFGAGVRIAALRRSAPADSPGVSALIAAELPIMVIEGALVALCSFTLVGPLGLPWWLPLVFIAAGAAVIAGLTGLARGKRDGFWEGLAVMRGLRGRTWIIVLVLFAVSAQVVRNWLVLKGIGVDVSWFDAIALLIGAAVLGMLPVGPTLGVATAVVILGANGVAITAAAGALLTATAAIGALCFAAWALLDRTRRTPVALAAPAAG